MLKKLVHQWQYQHSQGSKAFPRRYPSAFFSILRTRFLVCSWTMILRPERPFHNLVEVVQFFRLFTIKGILDFMCERQQNLIEEHCQTIGVCVEAADNWPEIEGILMSLSHTIYFGRNGVVNRYLFVLCYVNLPLLKQQICEDVDATLLYYSRVPLHRLVHVVVSEQFSHFLFIVVFSIRTVE